MQEIPRESLETATNVAIILGIVFSYLQIRKAAKSIEVGQKANSINVLNSFTKEYDEIMIKAAECNTSKKVATWYFRFWNLLSNEFLFYSKGLLERNIFEFWSFKMCLYYNQKPTDIPFKGVSIYRKSHLEYMKNHNGNYPKSDAFFLELIKISEEERDKAIIGKRVHKLVKKYCKANC
ncbi:MAG: hypothetical protein WA063_06985 [Minisyncoccia bacterium]